MQVALRNVSEPQEGADTEALRTSFSEAKQNHLDAQEALERFVAVEEARSNMPVAPVEDASVEDGAERVATPAGSPSVRGGDGPLTYGRTRDEYRENGNSIFRDIYEAKQGSTEARERLEAHAREMGGEAIGEFRAISTTAGAGGEFVPPVWEQQDWIKLPRAGRPIANTLNKPAWIPGTNSINIPKVNVGTKVAVQTDGGAVTSTDLQTTSVTGAVQTIAGQEDVSQQLVDLSVPGIDEVIWDDLTRVYDTTLDGKTISGSVTNAKGIAELAETTEVAFTTGTPTVAGFYKKLAKAIAEVNVGIFAPPTVIGMHPLRWAWILAATDSNERPLVVPVGSPGFNAAAMQDRVAPENLVGSIQGLPVVLDASIPTNKGAGTNQDEVYVYRADQLYLYESPPRLRVFEEVLSGNLQVRFQLYGYYAAIFGRLPKAISKITGTGLIAPTF